MREHITILGALYTAFGIMGVIAAAIVLVAVAGGGFLSGDPEAIWITSTVGVCVSSFLFLLSAPGIIAGAGLLKRRPWARILTLILGAINLVNLPFGTMLGIYTIWVLIQPEALEYLSGSESPS